MKSIIKLISLITILCAMAYSAPTDEQIQLDIQQQMQDERRQRELDDALRLPTDITPPAPAAPQAPADNGNCVNISKINYSGNTIFTNIKIDALIAPYSGKCLTITEIDQMLQMLTNLYIEAGYITSRAYIAMAQGQLGDGVLEIKIFEGLVADIVLDNITNAERFVSFPNMAGKPLYLRDIEQGIDQMNKLASNKVSMTIVPTNDSTGASDILLTNVPTGTTAISATLDSLGSDSTGEWRMGIGLSQDNLLGINDLLYININKALANSDKKDFRSFTAGLSIPFRYVTLNNNFSYSDYTSSYILQQSRERFFTLGDSYNNNISLEYLYWRGKRNMLNFSFGYTYKKSHNYMKVADFQVKNEASSRELSSIAVEFPSTFYFPSGVLYFKPSYIGGIKLFGALDDNTVDYPQQAQYQAWKVYLYYSHSFSRFSLAFTADGQYSGAELYGSEGFSIGGEGTVRGFKEESAVGDKGIVLKAELSSNLGVLFGTESLKHYSVSTFYDWGSTSSNADDIEKTHLAGVGASIRADFKYFYASITYATALSKPRSFTESRALYCRMGGNYRF